MRVVHVRTQEDLDVCLRIRKEVFVDEQNVPIAEEIDDQDVVGVGNHLYLVDDADTPVATARFKPYDHQTAKIQRVAVRADYRGQGFGRKVMEAVEAMAADRGYAYAVLDAQCHAEGFYQGLGYQTISSEPFYDAGILHVKMRKRLKEA
ncbi:GNAT family N-acetyltransferase [Alicyclobacillus acidiphilus]|uniref:GNAT family N-acetyltransferase n=1 Tax=Alicyclobacillus acidiphilus TaxID=182455 RepID=UPI000830259E|nr:GNAT family N-acetyltransferase [Alicyclobacillus acidiphilus]